ncbi:MAG: restriction endonuclease subunit S [Sphaerochaetaceae bacterium]
MPENFIKPAIRFAGFDDAWEQHKLGDVIKEFYNGKTPYRQNDLFWDGNINWLASGDLNRGLVTKTAEQITEEGMNVNGLHLLPPGTMVIAIMGLEAAGTRGNCGILGIYTTINQACLALFPDMKYLDTQYCYQWYKSIGDYIGTQYTQGTKQQNFNVDILRKIPITLPCLNEQKKIATILTRLDQLITLHQRKYDKLVSVKKSMLEKMFPKNGSNIPEIRVSGFTDPWEQRKLGEIADVKTGPFGSTLHAGDYVNDGEPIITTEHFKSGELPDAKNGIPQVSEMDYIRLKNYQLLTGDIVFSRVGSVDINAHITSKQDGWLFSSRVLRVRPSTIISSDYLHHELSTERVRRDVILRAVGQTMPSINTEILKTTQVHFPQEIKEQVEIGQFFNHLENLITLYQRKLEKLKNIKKSMLEKMFV